MAPRRAPTPSVYEGEMSVFNKGKMGPQSSRSSEQQKIHMKLFTPRTREVIQQQMMDIDASSTATPVHVHSNRRHFSVHTGQVSRYANSPRNGKFFDRDHDTRKTVYPREHTDDHPSDHHHSDEMRRKYMSESGSMSARPWSQQKRDKEKTQRVHRVRQENMRRNRAMDTERARKRGELQDASNTSRISYMRNTRKSMSENVNRKEDIMEDMQSKHMRTYGKIDQYEGRGDPTVWGTYVQRAHLEC